MNRAREQPCVVGYVRVSTLQQLVEGHGLDVQRDKVRRWASAQDLELEHVFEDAGISGATTDERPGLRAALRTVLAASQKNRAAVLVVYKLDRLGRSTVDLLEVMAVLTDAGVRVVSLSDGVDSGSAIGAATMKMLITFQATFAELERDAINARLLDGRRRADAENRPYASEPGYGRRVENGVLVEDEGEKAAVARARELRGLGRSYRQIAAQLLAEGFKPRRAPSWSCSVLQRLVAGRRPAKKKKIQRIERARAELLRE